MKYIKKLLYKIKIWIARAYGGYTVLREHPNEGYEIRSKGHSAFVYVTNQHLYNIYVKTESNKLLRYYETTRSTRYH